MITTVTSVCKLQIAFLRDSHPLTLISILRLMWVFRTQAKVVCVSTQMARSKKAVIVFFKKSFHIHNMFQNGGYKVKFVPLLDKCEIVALTQKSIFYRQCFRFLFCFLISFLQLFFHFCSMSF